MKRHLLTWFLLSALLGGLLSAAAPHQQLFDPSPPATTVKLIFIHHSTGENWLTDGYGDLGKALNDNNYFVSDTNYGWGPNSIGDRTDIPNWIEWFRSDDTPRYMQALFNESEQHANYTRTLADPGGENEIILFKSCFPNSALTGNPNDPPGSYEDLSVSGAKYVYNQILSYFATRPDKLFVVITAPPLSDPTYAENARAFNLWLVSDWLDENKYPLNNVAVFDFYNVLTARDAHHRFRDGYIEHGRNISNTLAYPSGDDHPSQAGSRKATEEFVPLLNVFYHRWKGSEASQPSQPASPTNTAQPPVIAPAPPSSGLLDDFEQMPQPGTTGWQAFWDESTATRASCARVNTPVHTGAQALQLDFDLAPNAWTTCLTWYDTPQDWSSFDGLTFFVNASEQNALLNLQLYVALPDTIATYQATFPATQGWQSVRVPLKSFERVAWEEDGGTPLENATQVQGLAFALDNNNATTHRTGQVWMDDLSLFSGEAPQLPAPTQGGVEQPPQTPPTEQAAQPESSDAPRLPRLPCAASLLPLSALLWLSLWRVRR